MNDRDLLQPLYSAWETLQAGQWAAAEAQLRPLSENPALPAEQAAQVWQMLGFLHFQQQQWPAAEQALRQALKLDSDHPDWLVALGHALRRQQRFTEALSCWEEAYAADPRQISPEELLQLSRQCAQWDKALIWLGRLRTLQPENPEWLLESARGCAQAQFYPEALAWYQAYLHTPEHALPDYQICLEAGDCAFAQCTPALAKNWYSKACELAPADQNFEFPKLTCLPILYASEAEILEVRNALNEALEQWIQEQSQALKQNPQRHIAAGYAFYLAFHGLNDRPLAEKLGKFFTQVLKRTRQYRQSLHHWQPDKPIRVGFVSCYFYTHSVSRCYQSSITQLQQQPGFEVGCFYLGRHFDQMTQALQEQVSHFVACPTRAKAQAAILAWEPDVLIYTDIGMDPNTYLLALHKLAPFQGVLAGHPVTTGIPAMDFFFSSELTEPENAQEHYSEKLILFSNSLSVYKKIQLQGEMPRESLGFPAGHVYLCPMTLFKIHPAMYPAFRQILSADPLAQLCFYRYQRTSLHEELLEILQRQMPEFAPRIHILPWAPTRTFHHQLAAAEVVLDTFPFGGGTTSRQAFALGCPMVTLEGQNLRGRITAAMYRRMGLPELISDSVSAYASRAVALACDPSLRTHQRQLILARNQVLFDNPQGISELAEFLRQTLSSGAKP